MTSRAVVLAGVDQPLELRDFEVPEPGEMAAVVEVELGGICGTDVHLHHGHLPVPTPVVLGHEAVGRVSKLGAGLTRDVLGAELHEGDLVSWLNNIACGRCFYCLVELEPTLCTGSRKIYGINQSADDWPHLSGGWGDYIYLQPGTVMVKLPEGVEAGHAIALGCAGPTAWHGVLDEVRVRFGDVVVIQGSGPVGVAAAIYAQLAGAAKVILVGGPAERLRHAREIGVGDVHVDIFETTKIEDRVKRVQGETRNGLGADVVVECTGMPSAVAEGIAMARPNAQYCVLGQYTDVGPTEINPHQITRKQLHVHGSWGFSARHYIGYVSSLPKLVEHFDLASLLSEYPLEEANQAVADVENGRVMKGVLRAGSAA